jgi:peroxiredoxin
MSTVLTAEAEKELTLVGQRLKDANVDQIDAKLAVLVIFPSTHSPTGLIM